MPVYADGTRGRSHAQVQERMVRDGLSESLAVGRRSALTATPPEVGIVDATVGFAAAVPPL